MMRIDTKGYNEWLTELKKLYKIEHTTLNTSSGHLTVLISRCNKSNVLAARFDRITGEGYVLDKRKRIRE